MQSETFLLHPGISVGVSEMPRRKSEVARRTNKGGRETELRKQGARALVRQGAGVLVLLAEMVMKN